MNVLFNFETWVENEMNLTLPRRWMPGYAGWELLRHIGRNYSKDPRMVKHQGSPNGQTPRIPEWLNLSIIDFWGKNMSFKRKVEYSIGYSHNFSLVTMIIITARYNKFPGIKISILTRITRLNKTTNSNTFYIISDWPRCVDHILGWNFKILNQSRSTKNS